MTTPETREKFRRYYDYTERYRLRHEAKERLQNRASLRLQRGTVRATYRPRIVAQSLTFAADALRCAALPHLPHKRREEFLRIAREAISRARATRQGS